MLSLSRGRPTARPAVTLAVAALALVPSIASAAPPRGQDALSADPMATGPYPVQRVSYDVGDLRLGLTRAPGATLVPLRGSVTFPKGKADPSRLVVYLHGNHGTCRRSPSSPQAPPADAPAGTPSTDPCPDWAKVDSFAGYDYLSDNLASHGYVVVSPEANLAYISGLGPTTSAGSSTGSAARSQILQATIEAVRSWNAGDAVMNTGQAVDVTKPSAARASLKGQVDLAGGIGLMGHSRGGAGVVDFLQFNRNNVRGTQWLIDATLALEPTTYTDSKTPEGTNFATLLGGCDGDMGTLEGANFFGLAKYRPANARTADLQFYVEGANHNFYNTVWAADGDDAGGTCGGFWWGGEHPEVRLSEPDQQKTGIALMNAFMRRYVGDEAAMEPLMTGETTLPASACPTGDSAKAVDCRDLVRTSYIGPDEQRLDLLRPDGADPTGTTATGGTLTASGLTRFELCDPQDGKPSACPPGGSTAPSWGDQFTVGWDGPASLTAQLAAGGGPTDLTGTRALQLRTALDDGEPQNRDRQAQDYAVTLTDATGASATTKVSDWSSSLRAPFKPQTVLNGVWIPLSAFAGVDLSRAVSLRFDFGGEGLPATGLIQLSDVSFLRKAPAAVQPSIPAPNGPPSPLGTTLATTAVSTGKVCRDVLGPRVRSVSLQRQKGRILVVRGRSSDRTNCQGERASAVRGTMVAIRQPVLGKKGKGQCRYLDAKGRWGRAVPCRASRVRYVKGTTTWSLRARLPKSGLPRPGVKRRTLTVLVRSYDRRGNLGTAVKRTLRYP